MAPFTRIDLPAEYLRSLIWRGDTLEDLLAGGTTYTLDGQPAQRPAIGRVWAFSCNAIEHLGKHLALVQRRGTKAVLIDLDAKRDLRELNRSYYHAEDYDYPIALFNLPDGRPVVAYCPEEYCRIEIEDLVTRERLTPRTSASEDVFHTRLTASPDGRYLAEAAWVWHPWNIVQAWRVEEVLADPTLLDKQGLALPWTQSGQEVIGATFCGARLVGEIALDGGELDFEAALPDEPGVPAPNAAPDAPAVIAVQVVDLDTDELLASWLSTEHLGRTMAVGDRYLVAFSEHPRLIDLLTGRVLLRWPDLGTGPEVAHPNVSAEQPQLPWIAPDPARARFAIGWSDRIVAIDLRPWLNDLTPDDAATTEP